MRVRSALSLPILSLALTLTFFGGMTASASPLLSGTVYAIGNHPDGSEASPFYGLRLDGLRGDTSEEWTFDFGHVDSAMFLVWDSVAATIDIYGQSFGGSDIGSSYDPNTTSTWDIAFRYENVLDLGAELRVDAAGGPHGSGTIANTTTNVDLPTLETYDMIDFGSPHTFHLRAGHRGFSGLSGWGWVNHSGGPDGLASHVYSSDWLFTVEAPSNVPEPTVGVLLAGGLLFAGRWGRRRR